MRQEPAYRLVLKAEKAAKSNRPALPGAQKKKPVPNIGTGFDCKMN